MHKYKQKNANKRKPNSCCTINGNVSTRITHYAQPLIILDRSFFAKIVLSPDSIIKLFSRPKIGNGKLNKVHVLHFSLALDSLFLPPTLLN